MSLLCRLKNLVHKGVLKEKDLDRIVIIPKEQEPCEDCISRKAVIEVLTRNRVHFCDMVKITSDLKELPSLTPKPKTGHWVGVNPMVDTLMCSECGENIISEEFKSNYCPNCGADMRGTE